MLFNNIAGLPILDSIDSRIVLQELYDSQLGIFDHLDPHNKDKPLASISMHEGEEVNSDSLLEEKIRIYVNKSINTLYGLSLVEFLELPREVIDTLITIAGEEESKKAKILAEMKTEFGK